MLCADTHTPSALLVGTTTGIATGGVATIVTVMTIGIGIHPLLTAPVCDTGTGVSLGTTCTQAHTNAHTCCWWSVVVWGGSHKVGGKRGRVSRALLAFSHAKIETLTLRLMRRDRRDRDRYRD
jgi:hypothetical protein